MGDNHYTTHVNDFESTPRGISDLQMAMPASQEILTKVAADPMITLLTHPVIQHKISLLRRKSTGKRDARMLVQEIAVLEFYEQTRHLPMRLVSVETPVATAMTPELDGKKPVLVPILRAGAVMAEAIQNTVMPSAKVGQIGMRRNPRDITQPICYCNDMPGEMSEREAFVLDPMLATGWSAAKTISLLKEKYGCRKIHFACIISVWDGIEVLRTRHPDVDLCIGVVDVCLDRKYYIIPGAGDMGDRIYGTE